jgi:hypothetical protein
MRDTDPQIVGRYVDIGGMTRDLGERRADPDGWQAGRGTRRGALTRWLRLSSGTTSRGTSR